MLRCIFIISCQQYRLCTKLLYFFNGFHALFPEYIR